MGQIKMPFPLTATLFCRTQPDAATLSCSGTYFFSDIVAQTCPIPLDHRNTDDRDLYDMVCDKEDKFGKTAGGANWSIIEMVRKFVDLGVIVPGSGSSNKYSARNTKKLRRGAK